MSETGGEKSATVWVYVQHARDVTLLVKNFGIIEEDIKVGRPHRKVQR